jgi:hypothetical protein
VTSPRTVAGCIVLAAIAAAAVATLAFGPVERAPEFHRYADERTWLGIPHAGDVLSNLAFVIAAAWMWPRVCARGLPGARMATIAVGAIGVGSGVYHWAPSDTTLVLDWASITIALSLVLAAVIRDRVGEAAGHAATAFAPLAAALTVAWWLFTGGTVSGGNMAPYVAGQALGVALPPVLALAAPGRAPAGYLLAAVAGFGLARLAGRFDGDLLAAVGVSGHSAKHVLAAFAAALALRGLAPHRGTAVR